MDAAAFWQENKRWLGSIGIGLVVWFIGGKIVSSIANPSGTLRTAKSLATAHNNQDLYKSDAETAARAESEKLRAQLARLEGELSFEPDAKYDPAGKGMTADDYLTDVGSKLRRSLVQRCNRLGVDLSDKRLVWPTTGVLDEIRSVLSGLNLIEVAATRLLDAHEQARKNDPEANGLRSIDSFSMEDRRTSRRSGPKPGKPGEPDLSERLTQERISFTFQSDTATALLFFEALRMPRKTLVVENVSITGGRAGEPVTVKGTLLGVVFRKPEGP